MIFKLIATEQTVEFCRASFRLHQYDIENALRNGRIMFDFSLAPEGEQFWHDAMSRLEFYLNANKLPPADVFNLESFRAIPVKQENPTTQEFFATINSHAAANFASALVAVFTWSYTLEGYARNEAGQNYWSHLDNLAAKYSSIKSWRGYILPRATNLISGTR